MDRLITKTTWRLELISRDQLQPKGTDRTDLRVEKLGLADPEFNRFMHDSVGADFLWGGRHGWGEKEWTDFVDRENFQTWVFYVNGSIAGYSELDQERSSGAVRIHTFGLRKPFIGQGLGGYFLTQAVLRAWDMGATMVWLTTCSHDHPLALQNYLGRGFAIAKETETAANATDACAKRWRME